MNLEIVFSVAGVLAMIGWLVLLASPLIPTWSHRIAGRGIPVLLSVGYVILALFFTPATDGGFGSLQEIQQLFSQQEALMALWIHVLAFDLIIGAWMCEAARTSDISFWLVVPCLALAFLFGPAGFLLFWVLRHLIVARKHRKTVMFG